VQKSLISFHSLLTDREIQGPMAGKFRVQGHPNVTVAGRSATSRLLSAGWPGGICGLPPGPPGSPARLPWWRRCEPGLRRGHESTVMRPGSCLGKHGPGVALCGSRGHAEGTEAWGWSPFGWVLGAWLSGSYRRCSRRSTLLLPAAIYYPGTLRVPRHCRLFSIRQGHSLEADSQRSVI